MHLKEEQKQRHHLLHLSPDLAILVCGHVLRFLTNVFGLELLQLDTMAKDYPDRFKLWYTVDETEEGVAWEYDKVSAARSHRDGGGSDGNGERVRSVQQMVSYV